MVRTPNDLCGDGAADGRLLAPDAAYDGPHAGVHTAHGAKCQASVVGLQPCVLRSCSLYAFSSHEISNRRGMASCLLWIFLSAREFPARPILRVFIVLADVGILSVPSRPP